MVADDWNITVCLDVLEVSVFLRKRPFAITIFAYEWFSLSLAIARNARFDDNCFVTFNNEIIYAGNERLNRLVWSVWRGIE